jgi:hypothetical protein
MSYVNDDLQFNCATIGENALISDYSARMRMSVDLRGSAIDLSKLAEQIYRSRRLRDKFFGDSVNSDGAWNMVLSAFSSPPDAKLTVTSVCYSSCYPMTSALRWLDKLINRGIFQRSRTDKDRRLVYINLTDVGREQMTQYLICVAAKHIVCAQR